MFWEEMYINTCNRRMKLLDAFDYTGDIPCYNSENLSEVIDEVERISVVFSKDKDIRLYELNLYNGFYLVCTKDQEVMTQNRGYVAVGDLCDSDVIIGALNNNSLFKSLTPFPHSVSKALTVKTKEYHNAFISNIMCKVD